MSEPIVDPEFKALLPKLEEVEYNLLSTKIELEGFRDKLVVWKEKNILVDGHHRLKICKEKQIPYSCSYITFSGREEVIAWMVNNQLAKRDLTDEQRAYYRGKLYLTSKTNQGGAKSHSETLKGDAAKKVAEATGSSRATIHRDAKFAEAVDKTSKAEAKTPDEVIKGKTKKEIIEKAFEKPNGKAKKKAPKPGKIVFDWAVAERQLGFVVRATDNLKRGYPNVEATPEFAGLCRLMREYATLWKRVRKSLTKEKE